MEPAANAGGPGMVHSHTEWGRLREVIVGDAWGAYVPKTNEDPELSFRLFFNDNLFASRDPRFWDGVYRTLLYRDDVAPDDVHSIAEHLVAERQADLAGLAALFERSGVRVRRPVRLERVTTVATPWWRNLTHPCYNVRDQVLVVGDEIIETPPLCRHRYFENDLLKDLFLEYFRAGARWTVAPRPTMRSGSFDRSYVGEVAPAGHDHEIMFDAAQCLRFGRDLLVNVANENHALGALWLERHLRGRVKVHVVHLCDNHVDSMILPLRPGTLLAHKEKMRGKWDRLPVALQRWDRIECGALDPQPDDAGAMQLASRAISVNVLSLDDRTVLVNEDCPSLAKQLERHGFCVVPLRLRHSRLFGGGLHCATLDVRREDSFDVGF